MTETPLVSVVILNYKRLDELEKCLDAATAQDYENLEIIEVEIDKKCPCVGKPVEDLGFPMGSRLISVLRDGQAEIAVGATVLKEGDQVLAILEPGREGEVRKILLGR